MGAETAALLLAAALVVTELEGDAGAMGDLGDDAFAGGCNGEAAVLLLAAALVVTELEGDAGAMGDLGDDAFAGGCNGEAADAGESLCVKGAPVATGVVVTELVTWKSEDPLLLLDCAVFGVFGDDGKACVGLIAGTLLWLLQPKLPPH